MRRLRAVFRTDASIDIGIGHVIRCLTLADALRNAGVECIFVCRTHQGNLLSLIAERGYGTHRLPLQVSMPDKDDKCSRILHADWLGAHWATDAAQTMEAIGSAGCEFLIVDHYSLDERWEYALREACRRLIVIDDLADRRHDCDLLIDQNLGRVTADYSSLVPLHCRVFTGPRYALIRKEFSKIRFYSLSRRRVPHVKNLLITMGGVDKENVTSKVLDALACCPLDKDSCITVVMGAHAPWVHQVREKAAHLPWRVEILVNVDNMEVLMAESDLAIGAAGGSSWERCCLGLPAAIFVLADNQKSIASALEAAMVVKLLKIEKIKDDLSAFIIAINRSPSVLTQMSNFAADITCGRGPEFILNEILQGE